MLLYQKKKKYKYYKAVGLWVAAAIINTLAFVCSVACLEKVGFW